MQTQQGKAAGRSAAEIVSSYTSPDRYRDFAAPTNSLEMIVPLVLEGASRGRRALGGRPPARTAGLGKRGAGQRGPASGLPGVGAQPRENEAAQPRENEAAQPRVVSQFEMAHLEGPEAGAHGQIRGQLSMG